jgi:hypothetical protein
VKVGDVVKHKKYGSIGIIVRLEDDNVTSGLPLARIIWTSSSATGACWPDEIEVISSAN